MRRPAIYYGDEIGLIGGRDPDCRKTFNWDEFSMDDSATGLDQEIDQISERKKLPCAVEVLNLLTLIHIQIAWHLFGY